MSSTGTTNSTKAANAKLGKAKKAEAKTVTPKPCACGCGGFTVTQRAFFISGHDAVLKSKLLKRYDEQGDQDAAFELVDRGWYTNDGLEARAEKREQEAKAKAEKAAKMRKADAPTETPAVTAA